MTQTAGEEQRFECPECGTQNDPTANFCENCGSDLRGAANGAAADPTAAGLDPSASETVVVRAEELERVMAGFLANGHAVAFKTDIGYSHHVNQDAGGVWSWTRPDGTPVSLVAVADGVSAGRHSEGASRLAVEIIEKRMQPLLQNPEQGVDELLRALIETAREANHKVAQRPHHSLSSADATTLVAAFCIGTRGAGIWCGDSRVYRVTRQGVIRLTRDHSWAEGVVSHGLMSAEDAARDPRAHMITRWLGPPDQEDPGLETFRVRLAVGDILLCCSDGLYMYFSPPAAPEEELEQVLAAAHGNLQGGVDRLVETALQRGGRDNITVGAIRVDSDVGEPESDGQESVPEQPAADQTVHLSSALLLREDDEG